MLSLEPVTPDNYDECLGLTVREDQAQLISPVVKSLADAYVWDALVSVARERDGLVGFVMLYPFELDSVPVVNIVRFMIDGRHQGRGLGRELLSATVEWIRSLEPVPVGVRVATMPENEPALRLYRSIGFEGSDLENGEVVLWLDMARS